MTDFVQRVLRPEKSDWIIRHATDTDFYKYVMGNFIFCTHRRGTNVTFEFINRNPRIPLAAIIDEGELRAQLDHVRELRHSKTEIFYLRGMDVYGKRMLREEYLEFEKTRELPPYELIWGPEQFTLRVHGPWESVSPWELYMLPIINELFNRTVLREMPARDLRILYGNAESKLYYKLLDLKRSIKGTVVDFGHRRRHSYLWQRNVVAMMMDILGPAFAGTSNVHLAAEFGLEPKGTNAHELQMVDAALAGAKGDHELAQAPYRFLKEWGAFYENPALRILLTDTFGSHAFYQNMPEDMRGWIANEWGGERFDSGSMHDGAQRFIHFVTQYSAKKHARDKIGIPSDGLDSGDIARFDEEFSSQIRDSAGWGTHATNGFHNCHPRGDEKAVVRGKKLNLTWDDLLSPKSIVCKPVSANGEPCVKLSNNPLKATGDRDAIKRYLHVFGGEGRLAQTVVV